MLAARVELPKPDKLSWEIRQLTLAEVKNKQASNDLTVLWEPHDKQSEYLAAGEFEVLYGGAAGGGKTDAILIDALGLQQGAIDNENYQAIIFRRTFPDLKDLIARAHQLYPDVRSGAKYDKQAHVWTFPSGARIEFGHGQYEADRFKYRGRAFQYVGFEELTLWPTSVFYDYLITRVRSTDPSLTCYVRANTNPDGPGSKWVKDRWKIPIVGTQSLLDIELKDEETGNITVRQRRFIPARLDDNPHLMNSGYRETLLLIGQDDPDTMKALLRGRWEPLPVRGAYYATEMDAARKEGRICQLHYVHGEPVNTFWDLGANDTTAICCHQHVARQDLFINGYEANGQPLEHYVKWLQDTGYVFGTHYLPHDADQHRQGMKDNRSMKEMLEGLWPGQKFVVVPRIQDVTVGIELTRQKLHNALFDEKKCGELVSSLENYRKEYDEKMMTFKPTPYHDWASNYADAFRQWAQGFTTVSAAMLGTAPHRPPSRINRGRSWRV